MVAKIISHYKILEKLGAGGMGVVYKAEDTKLKRTVALKYLPQELTDDPVAKKRFIQEAQSASSLDHPNICTIHEIDETKEGQLFIAMACYDGETLKHKIEQGPLEVKEAMTIAAAIAQGLAKAHNNGIVHRDIKPANIFITNDNQVKILDFGLAKLSSISRITRTGSITGTVAYMAPEMVRGEEIDHRADIWSLGVALFEMLTGQLPFQGENWESIMYAIANKAPISIQELRKDIASSLARIITKMLQKKVEDRYQDMATVITDLQNIDVKEKPLTPEIRPRASIVVLPFLDMSPGKDQEYLGDGLAEELINSLTAIKDLRVVARTSAFSFKGKNIDVRNIGQTLNVDHVLEGSVRKAGTRLRITAQLVSVSDGYHLWSEKYERTIDDMSDVFAIQDDISLAIVDKLKVKFLHEEIATLQKRYTDNLEAYDLYLKGRHFWNKRTEKDLKKSIECFNQAITIDSNYALAYAGLADSWIVLSDFSCIPSKEIYPRAKIQVTNALDIDNTLAEAYTSLGMIKSAYDWDWAGAEKDFKRAIVLKSGYATSHHWYASHLMHLARFQESLVEYGKALEFDPLSLPVNLDLGRLFLYSRQHDHAIRQLQKVVEMDPGFPLGHAFLGLAYLKKSMCEEALREAQRERESMTLTHPGIECSFGVIYARMGQKNMAEEILRKMIKKSKNQYVSSASIGWIHAALGNTDQAFECLERAYEEHDTLLRALKVSIFYDDLHSDIRYPALLRKMGLEEK